MDSDSRYRNEIEFMDAAADRALSRLPGDLTLSNMESFPELCASIQYLRSVPDFYGDIGGKRVLELGCGNGWISLRFAKSGADVWACDISPKMIQLANRYAKAADLAVTFQTMVCEEMTYEDDFFDFVFMHMALHHCDINKTAQQIKRVLKPGGKAVVVEDYAYHPLMNLYRRLTPDRHTEGEHPLGNDEISAFVSLFSSHSVDYSGLLNLIETSGKTSALMVKPLLRRVDDFLYDWFRFVRRYSRIVVIKVTN